MTREEAIKIAKGLRYDFKCESETMVEFCNMVIKALEQEPFINKPCVAHQVCHEDKVKILDKIRNEFIDRYPHNYANELEFGGRSRVFSLNEILQIIDKYKEESEDK